MSNIGLICYGNDGGLGAQSRRLFELIKPAKVLLIDSTIFSPNKELHAEWYPPHTMITRGFPEPSQILEFIEGLTHVFTCEDPYSEFLLSACRSAGIKTICQVNYEFFRALRDPRLSIPDVILMPSHWKLAEMQKRYGDRVIYLPPPINPSEFFAVRESNLKRTGKKRFLHVVGTLAQEDRNGTLDVLRSIRSCREDFELLITSQRVLPELYQIGDDRVRYSVGNFVHNSELYKDCDALILPRRYGGLSLVRDEALMAGLPVMMTNVSPNGCVLPPEWLVPARKIGILQAAQPIEIYGTDPEILGEKIDSWAQELPDKNEAVEIAIHSFSAMALKKRYQRLFN